MTNQPAAPATPDDGLEVLRVAVGAEHDGLRLDRFLAAVLPERSRSQIQRLVKDGRVAVDGRPCRVSTPVRDGQAVRVEVPRPRLRRSRRNRCR